MTIKSKTILVLMTTVLVATVCVSLVSIQILSEAFRLFTHPEYSAYPRIMSDRLYQRAVIHYAVFSVVMLAVTLPVAVFVFKTITKPYVAVLTRIRELALARLNPEKSEVASVPEETILSTYCDVLAEDLTKLQDYENISGWKQGARMLLHEIKNPLTPLKLTAEKLILNPHAPTLTEDVKRIHLAITDCEKVLYAFQELIGITFPSKTDVLLKTFLDETALLLEGRSVTIQNEFPIDGVVFSEPSLLRMVCMNLINNGVEACSQGFYVRGYQQDGDFFLDFVTPNQVVPDLTRIFKIGFSTKGRSEGHARGYGLYIAQQVMQYLNHQLGVLQVGEDLVFRIRMDGYEKNTHR